MTNNLTSLPSNLFFRFGSQRVLWRSLGALKLCKFDVLSDWRYRMCICVCVYVHVRICSDGSYMTTGHMYHRTYPPSTCATMLSSAGSTLALKAQGAVMARRGMRVPCDTAQRRACMWRRTPLHDPESLRLVLRVKHDPKTEPSQSLNPQPKT